MQRKGIHSATEALHVGMKEKANEFKDSGGEIYNSAPST